MKRPSSWTEYLELSEQEKLELWREDKNRPCHWDGEIEYGDVVGSGKRSCHKGCGGRLIEIGSATLHSITVATFRCDKCGQEFDISDQVFTDNDEQQI